MTKKILLELKKYQYDRGETSPFDSHIDFSKWADTVSPLLLFDKLLHRKFKQRLSSANVHYGLSSSSNSYTSNINACIGVVNEAIQTLQHDMHKNKEHIYTASSAEHINKNINNFSDIFFKSNYRVRLVLCGILILFFVSGVSLGQSALYAQVIAPIISLYKKKATDEIKTIVPVTPKNIIKQTNN